MMLSNDKPVHDDGMDEKLAWRFAHNMPRLPANRKLDGTIPYPNERLHDPQDE